MLPALKLLRNTLLCVVQSKAKQGHAVDGLREAIIALPDSYDAMADMARRLAALPLRPDWPYVEPNDLASIWSECPPDRPVKPLVAVDPGEMIPRIECAFLSSVCGCILGKPVEVCPGLDELRAAGERVGEWPIRDYLTERFLVALGRRHPDWVTTVRERISFAASDDDLNYTVIGMLLIEQHGQAFTHENMNALWLRNLPAGWCWGPERGRIANSGLSSLSYDRPDRQEDWVNVLMQPDEFCGALIRADAYGYACPGNPALAAELAWRDATFTHVRTGIYGAMFAAAAIATAFVVQDPLEIFEIALRFVPRRSRFYRVASDSLAMVREASDWLDGYRRVHGKYKEYGNCEICQEIGTVMNTLRFAADVGDGIGKQVGQGNDTDSFGCTCGSILGAFFGPDGLDPRWLAPFRDTIHVALADFHEQRLSAIARRMGQLPQRLNPGS